MKSPDCIGGAIGISNRSDGNVSNTSEMTNYTPKDNSIYCFNGNFIAHCAYGIGSGIRYAVVLFIVTTQTTMDVVALWNSVQPSQQICPNCYRVLNIIKQFKEHLKFICSLCGLCCNSVGSFKKHVCEST
jgi:hypothetical protein